MDIDMEFEVLQKEVQLYIMGVINKDELLILINKKREQYGLKEPLKEIPETLNGLLKIAKKAFDKGKEAAEDLFK